MLASFWLCLFVIKLYSRVDIFKLIKESFVLLNSNLASISTMTVYGESLRENGFPLRPYENNSRFSGFSTQALLRRLKNHITEFLVS